jgi:S-adenosylmethionine decarboxylase
MIGLHLLIDGVLEKPLNREDLLHILEVLPARIDMSILSGPVIVEGVPENPGWTGFVIIDKSHIAVHTFTANNTISIDVYSCKAFDKVKVVEFLNNHIKFGKFRTQLVPRMAPE